MHSLVRRYIKTGIAFLIAGIAIGLGLIIGREVFGMWPAQYYVSAHTHAILVGFVMMMILGVALWLFPRPEKGDTRYDPRRAEWSYWAVTLGTGGRVLGEMARATYDDAWLRWGVVIASLAQVAGLTLFFYTMWSRVRAVGSAQREAQGERF